MSGVGPADVPARTEPGIAEHRDIPPCEAATGAGPAGEVTASNDDDEDENNSQPSFAETSSDDSIDRGGTKQKGKEARR